MKILITGITGFVGQNLQPYLENDFDVVRISRAGKAFGKSYYFLKYYLSAKIIRSNYFTSTVSIFRNFVYLCALK